MKSAVEAPEIASETHGLSHRQKVRVGYPHPPISLSKDAVFKRLEIGVLLSISAHWT